VPAKMEWFAAGLAIAFGTTGFDIAPVIFYSPACPKRFPARKLTVP
jgi:hypothetical protein